MNILIPAKSSSTRVPNKNVRLLGGRPLLSWVLHYTTWFPGARVHIATDSEPIFRTAQGFRDDVLHYPLRPEDVSGERSVSELLIEFASSVKQRPLMLLHPSSPFTFRSEFLRALHADSDTVFSGRTTTFHTSHTDAAESSAIPPTTFFTGNFLLLKGDAPVTLPRLRLRDEVVSQVSPLSAVDINTLDDLADAEKIARFVQPADFDDVTPEWQAFAAKFK